MDIPGVLAEHIIDYIDDLIFVIDEECKIVWTNKKAASVFGYSKEDFLNKRITELIVERDKWNGHIKELREKKEISTSLRFVYKNRDCVRYDVLISKLYDNKSGFFGYLVFLKDISKWVNFEENLLRIDRLVELGQIAAGIIHELKNPLTIIDQAAGWGMSLIQDRGEFSVEDKEEIEHILKEILKQTKRCKNIAHQVLDFVREKSPEKKEFDLVRLIEDTLKYIEPETKYLPLKIEKDFPKEPVFILSDYNLLQQVLVNLLINAIDAMKEKKSEEHRLGLKIKVLPVVVQIYISDSGSGIPAEIQDKIFELFFTTKPSGKGTGLGLAITKNIINRLGGEISFETEEGKGTTFIITLPLKNE